MGTRLSSRTVEHAAVLWNYFLSFRNETAGDTIVVCCSYDLRVMDYAVSAANAWNVKNLVISGRKGNWTGMLWREDECDVFHEHAGTALQGHNVLLERKAGNFGENIGFSRKLLNDPGSVAFVTKPNSVLRVLLTVPVQWPGIEFTVTSPVFPFPDGISNVIGLFGLINEMTGDIDRIIRYPRAGYQIGHELPGHVLESWEYLVDRGFTQNLVK